MKIEDSTESFNNPLVNSQAKPRTQPPRNRAGSRIYGDEEIYFLHDIVKCIEPLKANE